MSTCIIALPVPRGTWVTGATVVKRDTEGTPTVVRTPAGALYCRSRFTLIEGAR